MGYRELWSHNLFSSLSAADCLQLLAFDAELRGAPRSLIVALGWDRCLRCGESPPALRFGGVISALMVEVLFFGHKSHLQQSYPPWFSPGSYLCRRPNLGLTEARYVISAEHLCGRRSQCVGRRLRSGNPLVFEGLPRMGPLRRRMSRRSLGYVLALTMLVTLAGAAGMLAFEREAPGGGSIRDYGTALWWTAMIMTTMGSDYWPRTARDGCSA